MSSKFVLVCSVNDDGNTVASEIGTGVGSNPNTVGPDAWNTIRRIAEYLQQSALGRGINIDYCDTAVSASTTGTFTGAPSNNETMVINGVTFTAKTAAPLGTNGFLIGASVTATAANLAAAINASTTAGIINTVRASSALGVVTFYSVVPGSVGLNIPITEALSNFTVAAATFSTGGTQAHSVQIPAGVASVAS